MDEVTGTSYIPTYLPTYILIYIYSPACFTPGTGRIHGLAQGQPPSPTLPCPDPWGRLPGPGSRALGEGCALRPLPASPLGGAWCRVATLYTAYPVARGAAAARMGLENVPGSWGGCARRPRAWAADACGLVWALCGRESIFLFSHTNEFCGKSKVALEAGVAWARLKRGRRVCERGQMRKRLPACCGACKRVRRRGSISNPSIPHGFGENVPYLAETLRGAPSAACRPMAIAAGESPGGIAPHEVGGPRAVRRTGDAQRRREARPPIAEGWALWATGRWQVLPPEQREIAPVQRTPNGRSCAAGSSSWGP